VEGKLTSLEGNSAMLPLFSQSHAPIAVCLAHVKEVTMHMGMVFQREALSGFW